ncbi:MAG: SpoIIE family protein phosphatase [Bacteroidales bacterium]
MPTKKAPKFYGLRIYNVSSILYFFLAMPFLGFLAAKSIPQFVENQRHKPEIGEALSSLDSLESSLSSGDWDVASADSIARAAQTLAENAAEEEKGVSVSGDQIFTDRGPFGVFFRLMFFLTLGAYVLGGVYNAPFKRYFNRKRKGLAPGAKLTRWCRKHLLHTPLINAAILTLPVAIGLIYSLVYLLGGMETGGETEQTLFHQFFYLNLLIAFLEFLFIFYWQKHRVHHTYLEHVFDRDELKSSIFKGKGNRVQTRLVIASSMTTFLPLLIVVGYLLLSLSSIRDLGLESLSPEQKNILVGKWTSLIGGGDQEENMDVFNRLTYVNAIDALIMLVGIGSGVLVSLVYVFLFIRWTNEGITRPVRELQAIIRRTRSGQPEDFTIVRTNDEIGELAQGFNEMTEKLQAHVESISTLNRELEQKVEERTNEVVQQKEEIEAQKEEIQAQLDLTTAQKDTIARQNEQILDSIHYARRIQSALLPPLHVLEETFPDHFLLFRPRDIVSGDYYWADRVEDRVFVAVADCTGHGVPGAFLSMLGISLMNEIIKRSPDIGAAEFLNELRRVLIASLHQTGEKGEARDGIEIALVILDTTSGRVEFAGANRPLFLLKKPGGSAGRDPEGTELIQVKSDRMPIGLYEQEDVPFTGQEFRLSTGDALYLFSDGYVDQLGGPRRKTFRSKQFRELLDRVRDLPMKEQKHILETRLDQWQGDIEQIDDILVLGIRF